MYRTGISQVKIRNPPQPVTDNIATAAPPPADADAYTTPRRATKRFTDEVFAWNRRLNPHDDLDEHGKEKVYDTVLLLACRSLHHTSKSIHQISYPEDSLRRKLCPGLRFVLYQIY